MDLNKARNRHAVDAVVGLATQPGGFTLGELAQAVRARSGWSQRKYSVRQAAYDLAKLRGKKRVQRRDKSRRYLSDPSGVRTMCAYLLWREQVLKPLLAGVHQRLGRPPKIIAPLDQHYLNLRQEMNRTFETLVLTHKYFICDGELLILRPSTSNAASRAKWFASLAGRPVCEPESLPVVPSR